MLLKRNLTAFDTYHSGLLSQLVCDARNNGLFNISYIILEIFQPNVMQASQRPMCPNQEKQTGNIQEKSRNFGKNQDIVKLILILLFRTKSA